MEYHQAILIKHWDELVKISETISRRYNRPDLADDCFSEVFDKSETIFKSFDASRNDNIEGFMVARFRLYCRKWFAAFNSKQTTNDTVSLESLDSIVLATHSKESAALDALEEVIGLLGVIANKQDQRLFKLRAMFGWTFTDIAKTLGIPESNVRKYYNEILHQLQWYAKQRQKRGVI